MFQCALLLNPDRQMYHRGSDTPFVCRTTRLNEELGQVRRGSAGQRASSGCVHALARAERERLCKRRPCETAHLYRPPPVACTAFPPQVQYVLSDKTGTLTQNVMGWVWASVGGHLYGRTVSSANR